jgi:hypothetical protein
MADKPIPQPKADVAASEVEVLKAQIAALKEEVSAARTVTPVDGSVHGIESNVKARVALADGSIRLDY